ncbi:MAG: hypothetical protein RIF41_38635 [Polyangiaceae bacterium]
MAVAARRGPSRPRSLLVGSDLDEAALDLYAHPPLVRAGAYQAP